MHGTIATTSRIIGVPAGNRWGARPSPALSGPDRVRGAMVLYAPLFSCRFPNTVGPNRRRQGVPDPPPTWGRGLGPWRGPPGPSLSNR